MSSPVSEPATVLGSGSPGPTVPDTEPERVTNGVALVFEETGIDVPFDELVGSVREAAPWYRTVLDRKSPYTLVVAGPVG